MSEIAIVEPNTLTALGLRTILEELIPAASIRVFPTFEALIDDTPDMYAHYFISSQIYFGHTSFFLQRRPKTIVLSAGEQPLLNGVPTLNLHQPQDRLVNPSCNCGDTDTKADPILFPAMYRPTWSTNFLPGKSRY